MEQQIKRLAQQGQQLQQMLSAGGGAPAASRVVHMKMNPGVASRTCALPCAHAFDNALFCCLTPLEVRDLMCNGQTLSLEFIDRVCMHAAAQGGLTKRSGQLLCAVQTQCMGMQYRDTN